VGAVSYRELLVNTLPRKETGVKNFKADPNALYFCDNDAALCGEHLGHSAKTTGRDISGQRIEKVDAVMATAFGVRCEMCGKKVAK
jgi:hypothetical protein